MVIREFSLIVSNSIFWSNSIYIELDKNIEFGLFQNIELDKNIELTFARQRNDLKSVFDYDCKTKLQIWFV